MKIVIHFIKRDDDCLFVIHLKFTFSDNIKAVVSQVPVFRSRAALQLRKAAFTRRAATRRLHSFQWGKGGRGEAAKAAVAARQSLPSPY